MKSLSQIPLLILLVAALLLSGCAPLVAQASNPTDAPQPAAPTAAPLGSSAQAPAPISQPDILQVPDTTSFPAGPASDPGPVDAATLKYTSSLYHYQVGIPAGWNVQLDEGALYKAEGNPEYVSFVPAQGSLPRITIYALTGQPPFSGYEDCQSNLVFRDLDACRISKPAGQGPASEHLVFHKGDQNFQIVLEYEDPASLPIFDEFLTSFEFTVDLPGDSSAPVMAPFASKAYGYQVLYPANWKVSVDPSASAKISAAPEDVSFTPPDGSLLNIVIYARTGEPPFAGYENCEKNFSFRDLPACRISVPAGQTPAAELLIFQKGDAYFEIAMQHVGNEPQPAFDQFLTSFQFYQ